LPEIRLSLEIRNIHDLSRLFEDLRSFHGLNSFLQSILHPSETRFTRNKTFDFCPMGSLITFRVEHLKNLGSTHVHGYLYVVLVEKDHCENEKSGPRIVPTKAWMILPVQAELKSRKFYPSPGKQNLQSSGRFQG